MKKKIIVALLILIIAAGSASAFSFMDAAEGIKDSSIFVNIGVGFGTGVYATDIMIPPLQASVEYLLPIGIPLSVGGFFEMGIWKDDTKFYSYTRTRTETRMAFGAKAAWHVDLGLKNLDLYLGLKLGWMLWNLETKYSDEASARPLNNYDAFFYGFCLGARYFFTNNIGIYLEAGYSLVSFVNLGLAVKF